MKLSNKEFIPSLYQLPERETRALSSYRDFSVAQFQNKEKGMALA